MDHRRPLATAKSVLESLPAEEVSPPCADLEMGRQKVVDILKPSSNNPKPQKKTDRIWVKENYCKGSSTSVRTRSRISCKKKGHQERRSRPTILVRPSDTLCRSEKGVGANRSAAAHATRSVNASPEADDHYPRRSQKVWSARRKRGCHQSNVISV